MNKFWSPRDICYLNKCVTVNKKSRREVPLREQYVNRVKYSSTCVTGFLKNFIK